MTEGEGERCVAAAGDVGATALGSEAEAEVGARSRGGSHGGGGEARHHGAGLGALACSRTASSLSPRARYQPPHLLPLRARSPPDKGIVSVVGWRVIVSLLYPTMSVVQFSLLSRASGDGRG